MNFYGYKIGLVWSAIFLFLLVVTPRYRELEQQSVVSASLGVPGLPAIQILEGTISRSATLVSTLIDSGVDARLANSVAGRVRPVFDVRRIHAGNSFRVEKEFDGSLRAFEYKIDAERTLKVARPAFTSTGAESAAEFDARIETIELESRPRVLDFEIQSSLFGALDKFPKGESLAESIAGIFAWDVDFNVDIKKGAQVRIVVDEQLHDGTLVKYGPIRAAELVNGGRTYRAFRFADSYYDEKGNTMKRAFLTSPLKVLRVTSGFAFHRMHPILGRETTHLAIDYGAPEGTLVFAVANGSVIYAGPKGDLGNFVEIQHSNGLATGYGHLSRIAPGLVTGRTIKQDDMIGFVGQTGMATGPHLHYMMLRGGKAINPSSIKAEPPVPIEAKLRPQFLNEIAPYRKQLDTNSLTASK